MQDVVIDGVSLIANYRSQFTRVLGAYPYAEVIARLGGGLPEAPAMVAAVVPDLQTGPAAPSPSAQQELVLTAFPSEVSSSDRLRAAVGAQKSGNREKAGSTIEGHVAGSYWVQLGSFRSMDAAADLAERFRHDGATVSNSRLPNAASDSVDGWARVRVGPFANRSDALAMLQELRARGQAALIAEAGD